MGRPLLLALALSLPAAPALALTPEALWAEWQAQAAGFGFTLGAEAVPGEGGAMTLRNWTLAEGMGPATPLLERSPVQEVRLVPQAGGAVGIELVGLPPNWTVPGGAAGMGDLYLAQRGLTLTARDGEGATVYEIAAQSLQGASVPPRDDPAAQNVAAEVQGLSLRVPSGPGADRRLELSLAITGFAYVANLGDPQLFTSSSQSGRTEGDLGLTLAMTMPEGVDWASLDGPGFVRALDRGLSVEIAATNGPMVQSSRQDGFVSYAYDSTSGAGTWNLRLDRTELAMDGIADGGSVEFTMGDMGVPPIAASYGPIRSALRVPLTAQVDELGLSLSVEGLTLGEELWATADPRGLLPRDPLRLVVEGGGRMGLDLPALVAAEQTGAEPPPPVLESLDLRAFEFEGAGLRVTASGALAFPGGNPEAQPTGTAEVRLEGADRLIDAMVELGVLTDQEARDARLALTTMMRPGGAPDTREARIELKADGSVIANGVKVQ